jgi:hypothetical protein
MTKVDEQWVPKWHQKVIKNEPVGAHGRFFGILEGFENICFWMSFRRG